MSKELLEFLGHHVFQDFEPCQFEPFENRYERWLDNLSDPEDRRILQELALQLLFVGRKEFEALYRTAHNGMISNWIIDKDVIDVKELDVSKEILSSINAAWICPITDSFRINSFLKVNGITSRKYRPDWQSLSKFADVAKINNFICKQGISKIILLEDFVGSGTQSHEAVKFAASNFPAVSILFCPMVVCPAGHEELQKLATKHGNLTYSPVLVLPTSSMIAKVAQAGEPTLHADIRMLATKLDHRVKGDGPLGFKDTGALVVLFSNCPNNTIPIIHEQSDDWAALFPRVKRVK